MLMKEMIPEGFSTENKSEESIEESNQLGELRLKKRGQVKNKWVIHKNPKVIRYRNIQLEKTKPKLNRIFIPIFEREHNH